MATPPLPPSITDRIKARNQSVRWTAILKEVRQYRAYVCNIDSDTIMGVSVSPSIIMILSPNPICLGSAMAWDLSGSYAPGSSISSFAIDFGDTNTDTGQSGSHTYGSAGTFTVTATVVTAAGLTQTILAEVNVFDCSSPLLLNSIYASTDGSGVFYFE